MNGMKRKLKVAVLFGGCSSEYGVSLQSAHAVIMHMDCKKYEPVLIGITRQGDWYLYEGDVDNIIADTWLHDDYCTPVAVLPNRLDTALLKYNKISVEKIYIDAVFPVLHGRNGEDGTVQGLFELSGIPVVGCGVLASALCMDKDRAHKLVGLAGVRVPKAVVISDSEDMSKVAEMTEIVGYPVFVKPVKAGSSFGITKVNHSAELPDAVIKALAYDDEVIIEENIFGFEVGCSVMGDDGLLVGSVDEIELSDGFFDFREKYSLETSAIHVPARITEDTERRVQETARIIYKALGCSGFARVDMFLTEKEEIVFNEVNTIPGFTDHSRFPNMLKSIGMSFEEIVSKAIDQAVTG